MPHSLSRRLSCPSSRARNGPGRAQLALFFTKASQRLALPFGDAFGALVSPAAGFGQGQCAEPSKARHCSYGLAAWGLPRGSCYRSTPLKTGHTTERAEPHPREEPSKLGTALVASPIHGPYWGRHASSVASSFVGAPFAALRSQGGPGPQPCGSTHSVLHCTSP